MRCAGAYAVEERLPNETSEAAEEGTLAHEYAAALLQGEPFHMVGVDEEMQEHIAGPEGYVEYVRGQIAALSPLAVAVEYRVFLIPFVHGTADAILLWENADGLHLVVIDLKYGRVPVTAAGNEQLAAYLLGAFKQFDGLVGPITSATGVIFQPRRGGVSEHEWSRQELSDFENDLLAMVHASADPRALRTPTKYGCMWCRARRRPDICPERATWLEAEAARVETADAAAVLFPFP